MTLDLVPVSEANTEAQPTKPTRIAGKNGGTLTPYNSERAREAVSRRWELFRKAGMRALVVGIGGTEADAKLPSKQLEAYMEVVAKQAYTATQVTNDFGQYSTAAARFVREAIGADVGAPTGKRDEGGPQTVVNIVCSPETAKSLIAALAGKDDE